MRLTYDKGADALYIRLIEGDHACRVVRLTDDIALDFAEQDRLVGIEVLGASRLFGSPGVPAVELKDLAPLVVGK